jgi:hypothetical protein
MTTINALDTTLSGQSGTGAFQGNNSPTMVTPILGAGLATSINFGATTLQNYVEGTWTPVLQASSGTATYSTQFGSYTRIGNRILFECVITVSASTLSGNIQIAGLPFAAVTNFTSVSMWVSGLNSTAIASLMFWIQANAVIQLLKFQTGGFTFLSNTDLGSSATIVASGS